MVSVTGMTVAEINRQLDEMVVSVAVEDGKIIYTRRSGEEIDGGDLVDSDLAVAAAYPINSIFISTVPTNPADLLGIGTWQRFGKGRTLVSQDDTQTEFAAGGQEGGEKTHTLTTAEMPAHAHVMSHDHAASAGLNGGHAHNIAIRYTNNIFDEQDGAKDAITGVGSAIHGSTAGTDTGETLAVGHHSHTVDVTPFTGSTQNAGGVSGVTSPHNNLQPYITVYIWKRIS